LRHGVQQTLGKLGRGSRRQQFKELAYRVGVPAAQGDELEGGAGAVAVARLLVAKACKERSSDLAGLFLEGLAVPAAGQLHELSLAARRQAREQLPQRLFRSGI
jgi:hypothetical protein